MSDPFAVMKWAQARGQQESPLSTLGQGVGEVFEAHQQRQAQLAEEARQKAMRQNYTTSLQTYMHDQSPENLMALYQAAEPLGRFEDTQSMVGDMTDQQQQEYASELMGVYSALENDKGEWALKLAENNRDGYRRAGQEQKANEWDRIAALIKEGNIDQAKLGISIFAGLTETGREALASMYDGRKDRRDEILDTARVLEIVNKNPYGSDEAKRNAIEMIQGLPLPLGEIVAEMFSVASQEEDGINSVDLTKLLQGLRQEYMGYAEDYKEAIHSANQIEALVDSGISTGALDAGILDLFNRVTNPKAVVRQSDVARTQASQGLWEQVAVFADKIDRGSSFTPKSRERMMDVVNEVVGIVKQAEFEAGDGINESLKRLAGDDEETLEQFQGEVFGPGNRDLDPREQAEEEDAIRREVVQVEDTIMESEAWQNLPENLQEEFREEWKDKTPEEIRAEWSDLFEETEASEGEASVPLTDGQLSQLKTRILAANRDRSDWSEAKAEAIRNADAAWLEKNYQGGWNAFIEDTGLDEEEEIEEYNPFSAGGGN